MAGLASSLGDGTHEPHTATLAAELVVEDQLEPRIRIPSDLLRCVTTGIEIALLTVLGLLAKQTASGVDVDVIGASKHLAKGLIGPLHSLAFIALLVLPVALAVRLIMIGQLRRLAEATVIGLVAGGSHRRRQRATSGSHRWPTCITPWPGPPARSGLPCSIRIWPAWPRT